MNQLSPAFHTFHRSLLLPAGQRVFRPNVGKSYRDLTSLNMPEKHSLPSVTLSHLVLLCLLNRHLVKKGTSEHLLRVVKLNMTG